jgi:hypothetical protein
MAVENWRGFKHSSMKSLSDVFVNYTTATSHNKSSLKRAILLSLDPGQWLQWPVHRERREAEEEESEEEQPHQEVRRGTIVFLRQLYRNIVKLSVIQEILFIRLTKGWTV